MSKTPKISPYLTHLEIVDGKEVKKIKKVYVMYVDGDEKLCDCCDEKKSGIASIRMLCGDIACICKDCVEDILTIWE